MNKRAIENLVKAGAMDGLGGTRKQFMSVYVQIADHIAHDKKNNLAGQISLFDIAGEEDKEEFDIRMPNVQLHRIPVALPGVFVSRYTELPQCSRILPGRKAEYECSEDPAPAHPGTTPLCEDILRIPAATPRRTPFPPQSFCRR